MKPYGIKPRDRFCYCCDSRARNDMKRKARGRLQAKKDVDEGLEEVEADLQMPVDSSKKAL